MTTKVLTVLPHTPLVTIAKLIISYRIGSLLVTNTDLNIQGIITRSDVLRVIAQTKHLDQWI